MGTLKLVSSDAQYSEYTYTYNNKVYNNIHVFTTKANTQSVCPAVVDPRKGLSQINPSMSTPQDVICKTNACMHDYNSDAFYGIFYQGPNHELYLNGTSYQSIDDVPVHHEAFVTNYYPSFCVKKDGTAAIRWFKDKYALEGALPFCECIIGSINALVYDGKCVFNEKVWDTETNSMLIMIPQDANGLDQEDAGSQTTPIRYMDIGDPSQPRRRTLLGHKDGSNGVYYMVCTDSSMICKVAANFMFDLGCDWAVNMDGSSPVEMRIKAGYGPSGRVTSGGGLELNSAVCAYLR